MSHPASANFNDPTAREARLQKELRGLEAEIEIRTRQRDWWMDERTVARKRIGELEKALTDYRDALSDGPENCTFLRYEEVDAQAARALKGPTT